MWAFKYEVVKNPISFKSQLFPDYFFLFVWIVLFDYLFGLSKTP